MGLRSRRCRGRGRSLRPAAGSRLSGATRRAGDPLASAIIGDTELALFENAYSAYADSAHRTALAFLGDRQLAADAVHNAFLEILRHLLNGSRWSDPAEARAVVLRNTRWAALNVLRSRRRREPDPALASPLIDDEATWAQWEARALCEQIVAELRPRHQEALRLHFTEGLSKPQAAARLGMTTAAYTSQLRRAVAAARRAARRTGVLAGLGWLSFPLLRSRLRAVRRRTRASSRPVPAMAQAGVMAMAGILAVHTVDAAVRATAPVPVRISMPTVASHPSSASLRIAAAQETLDDVVFADAVAVGAGAARGTVLAAGAGRRCSCSVVARSLDAGGHWAIAAGPPSGRITRVAVAAGFPADPRILVATSSSAGPTGWTAAQFGAEFLAVRGGVTTSGGSHPVQRMTTSGSAEGGMLAIAGHLLFFPTSGSVLCSVDGGRRWRSACADAG